jgi:hypothetical protein
MLGDSSPLIERRPWRNLLSLISNLFVLPERFVVFVVHTAESLETNSLNSWRWRMLIEF